MTDMEKLLSDYLLGLASADQAARLEQQLSHDQQLQQQLSDLQEVLVHYSPTAKTVHPDVRSRILLSIAPDTRFFGFTERLATLFELSTTRMQAILRDIESFPQSPWETSLVPNMHALHFDGGGNLANAECGVVHMESGTQFPSHSHQGREATFILQGELTDSDGSVYLPGDLFYKTGDDVHSYQATGDTALVFVVYHHGIEID